MDKIYIIENYANYGGFSINSVIYGSSDYSNVYDYFKNYCFFTKPSHHYECYILSSLEGALKKKIEIIDNNYVKN